MPDSAGLWTKWTLRDGGNGEIMLESVRYGDNYLDAHHSHNVKITHSHYPYNQNWAKWILTEDTRNRGTYYIESVRYPNHYIEN